MKGHEIVAGCIIQFGQGTLTNDKTMRNAYCIVLVHQGYHQLLGMRWRGAFYADMFLPFDVRSPAKQI